jgi:hypothetical protein
MTTTTGTSIESYLDWAKKEIETKSYGEVNITFIINCGKVVDVKKVSMDHDHFPLDRKKII